ncbi:hypothetical protein P3L10_021078 [Capsicum annuum]
MQESYTPAIDIWSIGCISVEVLTEKPLFLGKNIVHHLDLITDLLGTPSADIISGDYVATTWYRAPELCGSFYSKYTPAIDIWSVGCISAEALADPYFKGLAKIERGNRHNKSVAYVFMCNVYLSAPQFGDANRHLMTILLKGKSKIIRLANKVGHPLFGFGQTLFLAASNYMMLEGRWILNWSLEHRDFKSEKNF